MIRGDNDGDSGIGSKTERMVMDGRKVQKRKQSQTAGDKSFRQHRSGKRRKSLQISGFQIISSCHTLAFQNMSQALPRNCFCSFVYEVPVPMERGRGAGFLTTPKEAVQLTFETCPHSDIISLSTQGSHRKTVDCLYWSRLITSIMEKS